MSIIESERMYSLATFTKQNGKKTLYLTGNYDGKIRNNNKLAFWLVVGEPRHQKRRRFANTYLSKYWNEDVKNKENYNLKITLTYTTLHDETQKTITLGMEDFHIDKTPTDNTLVINLKKDRNNLLKSKIMKDISVRISGLPI